MTKAEQARLVAWRMKILRHAEQEPRYVAQTCRASLAARSRIDRHDKFLQVFRGHEAACPIPERPTGIAQQGYRRRDDSTHLRNQTR